jgi:hypothetical protein
MTVIARIQERFGHRFRLLDLARQTVGQLAAACEQRSHAAPPPWLWRAARAIKLRLLNV